MDEEARQRILDEEHLRLLRIGHLVMGGTACVVVLFGLLYVGMGIFFVSAVPSLPTSSKDVPPALMGWIFAAIGAFATIFSAAYVLLAFLSARALRLRRSRTVCLVTAAISCLHVPFGTAIGIMTFTVLGRPSVRALFASAPATAHQPPGPPPPSAPGLE